jgi:hypothetical protein
MLLPPKGWAKDITSNEEGLGLSPLHLLAFSKLRTLVFGFGACDYPGRNPALYIIIASASVVSCVNRTDPVAGFTDSNPKVPSPTPSRWSSSTPLSSCMDIRMLPQFHFAYRITRLSNQDTFSCLRSSMLLRSINSLCVKRLSIYRINGILIWRRAQLPEL